MQRQDGKEKQGARRSHQEQVGGTSWFSTSELKTEVSLSDRPALNMETRVLSLIAILTAVTITTVGLAAYILYNTSVTEERERLTEAAQSQARLIEAIARFDAEYSKDYPDGPRAATLSQLIDAHSQYKGFGETGEFTMARREGDSIVFLLSHRHFDLEHPKPVPLNSELAEPMRRALSGESGTVIGLDYRGELVLAAHEPVKELDLGIVAKIDLAEIRGPFIRAGLISGGFALLAVVLGAWLFTMITSPMIQRLQASEERWRSLVEWAPSFITIVDRDFNLQFINRVPSGVFQEEVLGASAFDYVVPECRDAARKTIERVFETGEGGMYIAGSPDPIRKVSWYENHVGPLKLGGRVIAATIISTDINERKQAQEALEWDARVNAAVAELANALVGPAMSINEIAKTVLNQARRVTGSENGFVSSIDPVTGDNVIHTFSHMMELCSVKEEEKKTVFPIGEDGSYPALWGHALNTREAFYVDTPRSHSSAAGIPEGHIPLNDFLTVPVMIGSELLGQIALANSASPYTDQELDAIQRIGNFYALALQRHWAKEELIKHQQELEDLVGERTRHLEGEIEERRVAERALQDLSGRLIGAHEEERGRIARELHDDLNQRIALLSVQLEQLAQEPPESSAQLRRSMRELWQQTKNLSSEIHNLSHRLRPSQLEHVGLVVAVRRLCKDLSRQQGIQVEFDHRQIPRSIAEDVALCLYRIVQEALHNVVKHTESESAQVELHGDSGAITLRIADSGGGFDPEAVEGKGGLGLANIRERVRLVGGEISIRSEPAKGTQLEISIPIVPKRQA